MGAVCNKSGNTKKIKVKSKPIQHTPQNDNQETTNQPKKVDIQILNEKVGVEFQKAIEENDPQFIDKQNKWKQIELKIESFQNDQVFIQLLNNDAQSLDDQQQQIISTQEQQVKVKKSQIQISDSIKKIADEFDGDFKFRNKQILEAYICKEQFPTLFSTSLMRGSLAKYRWSFWIASVYDNSMYEPKLYQKLKLQEVSSKTEDDIKKDLHRTFSNHGHFQDTLGQQQLFSILKALSIVYDDIGYVQGMNYVAAFCLIVNGGNEEETFWFLNFINKNPKFQWWELYRDRFPYAQFLLSIFHKNFSLNLPELYNKFLDEGFIDQQYVWQWILTQFIYAFPVDYVIQFWDFMLATDITSLIKLSIGILQDVGYQLQDQDLMGISLFFSNFIKENRCLDITAIIQNSQQLTLELTDNELQYLKAPDKKMFI